MAAGTDEQGLYNKKEVLVLRRSPKQIQLPPLKEFSEADLLAATERASAIVDDESIDLETLPPTFEKEFLA